MLTNTLKVTLGNLDYLATLTADSLQWTATTGFERQIDTITAYDELPICGFSYKAFQAAVKVASEIAFIRAHLVMGSRVVNRKVA